MVSAVIDIIRFAAVFKKMMSGGACFEFACFVDACAGFPSIHMICTFEPMLTTMICAVFFADHLMVVFIWFAGCRTAAAIKACFCPLTCDIAFAVFICATKLDGCLRIDACAVAAYIALGFTCGVLRGLIVFVTSSREYAR